MENGEIIGWAIVIGFVLLFLFSFSRVGQKAPSEKYPNIPWSDEPVVWRTTVGICLGAIITGFYGGPAWLAIFITPVGWGPLHILVSWLYSLFPEKEDWKP